MLKHIVLSQKKAARNEKCIVEAVEENEGEERELKRDKLGEETLNYPQHFNLHPTHPLSKNKTDGHSPPPLEPLALFVSIVRGTREPQLRDQVPPFATITERYSATIEFNPPAEQKPLASFPFPS